MNTPSAIMFLAGVFLVLFGLHGLDEKHGLLNHKLAPQSSGQ